MPLSRLFFALKIDSQLNEQAQLIQQELINNYETSASQIRLRLVSSAQFHLTLRFLGQRDHAFQQHMVDLIKALPTTIIPLQLKQIIGLPNKDKAHAVAIRLAQNLPLLKLYQTLNRLLSEMGLDAPHRDFLPHLTLLRSKKTTYHSTNS